MLGLFKKRKAKQKAGTTKRGNKVKRFGGKKNGVPYAVSMVNYSTPSSTVKKKVLVTIKARMTPQRANELRTKLNF